MSLEHDDASALAERIAHGHAWNEHRHEFVEVNDEAEFAALILRILISPTDERDLRRRRTAYWDDVSGTIVIANQGDADGGTCFRPYAGRDFFDQAE